MEGCEIKKGSPATSSGEPIKVIMYEEVRSSPRNLPKRMQHHEAIRLEPFSLFELRVFLSLLLYLANEKSTSLTKIWNQNPKAGGIHPTVSSLMSQNRFQLMYSCFVFLDEQMADFEEEIRKRVCEIWVPASFACCDESLVPFKGRKSNPHHVFIMRKPHPHGVKVCIDSFHDFMISFINFQRFGHL